MNEKDDTAEMTAAGERTDRLTRHAAVILAVLVLTLFAAASVMLLAGCKSAPCSGHGGVRYWSGSWSYCNDGTVQSG